MNSKGSRYKRYTNNNNYTPPTPVNLTGRVVEGNTVIHSQFGPVGVNNPSALLRNNITTGTTTGSTSKTGYETRRMGPTPLPVFTPPPLPSTIESPTFKKQVNLYLFYYLFRPLVPIGNCRIILKKQKKTPLLTKRFILNLWLKLIILDNA